MIQWQRFNYKILQNIKVCILFFKPTVIREEFTYDRIDSGELAETWGTSIYQDYLLIKYATVCSNSVTTLSNFR